MIRTVLTLFVLSLLFVSCKKGDGDPSLSFRSRKARISNNWELDRIVYNWSFYEGDSLSIEEVVSEGENLIYFVNGEIVDTIVGYNKLYIKSDWTYVLETKRDSIIIEEQGNWEFTDGDGRSKSHFIMNSADQNSISTRMLGIKRLANKEFVFSNSTFIQENGAQQAAEFHYKEKK